MATYSSFPLIQRNCKGGNADSSETLRPQPTLPSDPAPWASLVGLLAPPFWPLSHVSHPLQGHCFFVSSQCSPSSSWPGCCSACPSLGLECFSCHLSNKLPFPPKILCLNAYSQASLPLLGFGSSSYLSSNLIPAVVLCQRDGWTRACFPNLL